ncbi:20869_t:CDS:2 [Dentiscutata erythropus]|uniref:20869_t:CDS:1 n=1 Tax=Dentiscutata erythropus TaxID=1348616 RepID=A0A9N9HGQ7_9GLOM|nr:20869_t:CDS:2 [Dentiscutata erythropus]
MLCCGLGSGIFPSLLRGEELDGFYAFNPITSLSYTDQLLSKVADMRNVEENHQGKLLPEETKFAKFEEVEVFRAIAQEYFPEEIDEETETIPRDLNTEESEWEDYGTDKNEIWECELDEELTTSEVEHESIIIQEPEQKIAPSIEEQYWKEDTKLLQEDGKKKKTPNIDGKTHTDWSLLSKWNLRRIDTRKCLNSSKKLSSN